MSQVSQGGDSMYKFGDTTRTLLNIVHGIVNWFDASDIIGEWTRKHSDKEVIDLTRRLNSMKVSRDNKLNDIQEKLAILKSVGIDIPLPNNVANAFRKEQEKIQKQYDTLSKDNVLADDTSNMLIEEYGKKGLAGDILGTPTSRNKEQMYKEVINNVQEKFNEEKI